MADVELPPGWRTQLSRSMGDMYYVNEHTGDSTYDVPTGPAPRGPAGEAIAPLPLPATPVVVNTQNFAPLAAGTAPVVQPEPKQMLTADEVRELQRLDQRDAELRPLPNGWERYRSSDTGLLMYVNTHTHKMQTMFPQKPARPKKMAFCCASRLTSPTNTGKAFRRYGHEEKEIERLAHQEANLRPLPEGWQRVRASETGETYFLNTVTHRRVKEFPTRHAAHTAQGGCCSGGKPPKPTVETLSRDVHHLKVQVDDLYHQLSTQHHRQIEQWSSRYRRREALRAKRRSLAAWSRHAAYRTRAKAIIERMTGGRSKYGPKVWAFGRWVAMWRHSQRISFEERARELEHFAHSVRDNMVGQFSHRQHDSDVGLSPAARHEGRTMVMSGRAKTPRSRLSTTEPREFGDDTHRPTPSSFRSALRRATSSETNRASAVSVPGITNTAPSTRLQPRSRASAKAAHRSPERATRTQLLQRRMRATRGSDCSDDDLSSSSSESEGEHSINRTREHPRRRQHQKRETPQQLLEKMRSSPAASSTRQGRQSRRRP